MVSVCGVVIATIALVCALSVYNGFSDLVSTLFSNFDPELKITLRIGKAFDPTTSSMQKVKELPDVAIFSEVLEDNVLACYNDRQVVAKVKGVDTNFDKLTLIDSVLIDGRFALREDVVDYATFGIGIASRLGVKAGFVAPVELYAPKRDERINLANPASSLQLEYVYISGVFCTNQQEYDDGYVIIPLALARSLFRYDKEVTAIELKLVEGADVSVVEKEIKNILGDEFVIQDRYEQQESSYKMMQMEKWITFLILSFILMIALFNVVGSLSMLMIEKQQDVCTLRNMGASDALIRKIFLFEGWMISGFGAVIGVVVGVILCFLQQEFGLIKLGNATGAFIIEAYPVHVIFSDIVMVFVTVISIGFLAAWYPVHYLGRKWLEKK